MIHKSKISRFCMLGIEFKKKSKHCLDIKIKSKDQDLVILLTNSLRCLLLRRGETINNSIHFESFDPEYKYDTQYYPEHYKLQLSNIPCPYPTGTTVKLLLDDYEGYVSTKHLQFYDQNNKKLKNPYNWDRFITKFWKGDSLNLICSSEPSEIRCNTTKIVQYDIQNGSVSFRLYNTFEDVKETWNFNVRNLMNELTRYVTILQRTQPQATILDDFKIRLLLDDDMDSVRLAEIIPKIIKFKVDRFTGSYYDEITHEVYLEISKNMTTKEIGDIISNWSTGLTKLLYI